MSIRIGLVYENLFSSEAHRRDLDVSKPEGHHLPFDFIVGNQKGTLYRVQVKGTAAKQTSGFSFVTRRGKNRLKRVDYSKEIDVFVGIVERPGDRIFYIIPSSVLARQSTIRVFPTSTSKAKFEKYRNAWDIFEL